MKNRANYLLISALACMTACTGGSKTVDKEASVNIVLPDAVDKVTVMELKVSDFQHELISNGKLTAGRHVDLRFETSETVAAIHVKNGDPVSRGQPIAELTTFRLSNRRTQAGDALDRAKLDMQDILIGQGFAPEDSTKVPSAIRELAETKSGYRQALAQYELALHEEQNAVLRAPFDGVIANLFTKPFSLVSSAEIFCTVIDPRSLEASFSVLENELPLIQTGDRVSVTPFAMPDVRTEGRISEINPLIDENGVVRVKAAVNNSNKLFEGMNVRVSIRRSLGRQLVVPKEAVVIRSGRQVVFTLADGKAIWTYVEIGLENADNYTIVSGLTEGDLIITSGNINLAHESPVELR